MLPPSSWFLVPEHREPYVIAAMLISAIFFWALFVWVVSRQIRHRPSALPNGRRRSVSIPTEEAPQGGHAAVKLQEEEMMSTMSLTCAKDPKWLWRFLSQSRVFAFLNEDALNYVLSNLEYIPLAPGQTLYNRGEFDGSMYVVLGGKVIVTCYVDQDESEDRSSSSAAREVNLEFGPGERTTSLLSILCGGLSKRLEDPSVMSHIASIQSAKAAGNVSDSNCEGEDGEGALVVRLSASTMASVCHMFHEEIVYLSQTILSRVRRVTLRGLAGQLGLVAHVAMRQRERCEDVRARAGRHSDLFHQELLNPEAQPELKARSSELFADILSLTPESLHEEQEVSAASAGEWLSASLPKAKEALSAVEVRKVPPGGIVLEAGEAATHLYVVLSGEVDAFVTEEEEEEGEEEEEDEEDQEEDNDPRGGVGGKPQNWGEVKVFTVGKAELIGQTAIFTGEVSMLSMVAGGGGCILAALPRPEVLHVLRTWPAAAYRLLCSILRVGRVMGGGGDEVRGGSGVGVGGESESGAVVRSVRSLGSTLLTLDVAVKWTHIQASKRLVQAGQPAQEMHMVLSGRLRAVTSSTSSTSGSSPRSRPHPQGSMGESETEDHSLDEREEEVEEEEEGEEPDVTVEEYGRGARIGETLVMGRGRWRNTVYAVRDSELATLPLDVFHAVAEKHPQVLMRFSKMLAARLNAQLEGKAKARMGMGRRRVQRGPLPSYALSLATLAILPCSPQVPLQEFTRELVGALGAVAPTRLLDEDTLHRALGPHAFTPGTSQNVQMSRYLSGMEERSRLVVYRAAVDPAPTTPSSPSSSSSTPPPSTPSADFRREWNHLCVRQADCILLVCDKLQPPQLGELEAVLAATQRTKGVAIHLVSMDLGSRSSSSSSSSGAAAGAAADDGSNEGGGEGGRGRTKAAAVWNRWSEARGWVKGQHHVRLSVPAANDSAKTAAGGSPRKKRGGAGRGEEDSREGLCSGSDLRRLVRRVTGRSTGLVLGGGGARGLSHIGVIRALHEAGVSVDMVGGTSIGAFIGALYAQHPDDLDVVVEKARRFSKSMTGVVDKLFDLTLPITSWFNGGGFNRALSEELGGDTVIQDLILTYFCITADVGRQRMCAHSKGLLWRFVRASMTLSGYFPPIAINGSLYMDGGYMNNLPCDVMRARGAACVIGVDVSQDSPMNFADYGDNLSGWWTLWNRLNPFVRTASIPSMGDISSSLLYVSSTQHRDRMRDTEADMYLRPPVSGIGTLEFGRCEEVMELGYEYAKPLARKLGRKLRAVDRARAYSGRISERRAAAGGGGSPNKAFSVVEATGTRRRVPRAAGSVVL